MTDQLRQAAQRALEALETCDDFGMVQTYDEDNVAKAITALKAALEQQAEPVSHAVIAGALFDFMGWLTTRKERLILSSTDNASPAVESITEFAKMRGLSLDDARVQDWQNYTTPPQRPWVGLTDEDFCDQDHEWIAGASWAEAKLKERNNDLHKD